MSCTILFFAPVLSLNGLGARSQLDGWSEGGTATTDRRTPPFSSSPGLENSPRKATSPVGVPSASKLSSSTDGKTTVGSPTRPSPYHPFPSLVSPSASKPMTSPLHYHPSSPSSSTIAVPATNNPKLPGRQPAQKSSAVPGLVDRDGEESDDDEAQQNNPTSSKKPQTRAERRALQVLLFTKCFGSKQ